MAESIDLTTVFASHHEWEVHLARHALEQAGIETHIADDNTARMHWMRALAIGGVKLKVPGKDANRARQILLSMSKRHPPQDDKPDCPRCIAMKERYAKLHWFFVLTTFLTFGIPLFFRRVKQCPQCGKQIQVY